jgi:hypothetical protein
MTSAVRVMLAQAETMRAVVNRVVTVLKAEALAQRVEVVAAKAVTTGVVVVSVRMAHVIGLTLWATLWLPKPPMSRYRL